MSKHDFDVERKADELLRALGVALGESRAAYGEALMDETQPDPPFYAGKETYREAKVGPVVNRVVASDVTQPEELPSPKPAGSRRMARRIVILAAVLILVMGLFVVSSEGVRLKLSGLFFNGAEDSTKIMDDNFHTISLEAFEIGYVPDGLELVYDEVMGEVYREMEYTSQEGISLLVRITKTEQYSYNVDNENAEQEEIMINDKQAYLFTDAENSIIVWQMGDCTLQVTTNLSQSEAEEVAENIIIN